MKIKASKMYDEYFERLDRYNKMEKTRVKSLGDDIGYGRLMQLAEEIWDEFRPGIGEAHSVGCCTCFLVKCPHPEINDDNIHCDWCCGSGRVTKRVAQELEEKFKNLSKNK